MKKQVDIFEQLMQSNFEVNNLSDDFTAKVISKVDSIERINPIYKSSLISKKGWKIIATAYFTVFLIICFSNQKVDIWQFLHEFSIPERTIILTKSSILLCFELLFVIASIALGEHLFRFRRVFVK